MIDPISSSARRVDPANRPLADLSLDKNASEDDKVAEASRQFEAIFVRQILAEADKNGNSKGVAGGVYQEMVNDHLADEITRSGGLGFAKSLQAQLTHRPDAVSTLAGSNKAAGLKPSSRRL
jgi:flagellar protein FlgJ